MGVALILDRSSTGWIAPAWLAHSLDHLVGEQFIEVGTSMPSTLAGAASPDARRW
jgi:hypothetical protein